MGKLIWNEQRKLAEGINSPISFITSANLKKKSPEKKPAKKEPSLKGKVLMEHFPGATEKELDYREISQRIKPNFDVK